MNKMQEDHLANLARMQSDHSRLESGLRAEINKLETENKTLKETRTAHEVQIQRLQDEVASLKAKKLESAPA
jgi:cell division protein FtsB